MIRARIARPSSDRRRSPARQRLRHSSTTSTTAIPSVLPRPGLQRRHQSLGRPQSWAPRAVAPPIGDRQLG
jgi:hypothetical protein